MTSWNDTHDGTGRGEPLIAIEVESEPPLITNYASAAITVGAKHWGIPLPNMRWFAPVEGQSRIGQYDWETNTIWLSIKLASNTTERLKTIGHELHHAWQWHKGFPFDEPSARAAEDRFVEWYNRRTANLVAAAEASGAAPSIEDMKEIARRAQETLAWSARSLKQGAR